MTKAEQRQRTEMPPPQRSVIAHPQANALPTIALAKEQNGVETLKVPEIPSHELATAIQNVSAFINGMVNPRGTIAPTVDMRIKLNPGDASHDTLAVATILNLLDRAAGHVSEVISIVTERIRPAPGSCSSFDIKSISRLGAADNRVPSLADIAQLMRGGDTALIEPAVH